MQYLPKNPLNNFDQLFSFAQSQTAVVSSVSSCYFGLQVWLEISSIIVDTLYVTFRMPQDAYKVLNFLGVAHALYPYNSHPLAKRNDFSGYGITLKVSRLHGKFPRSKQKGVETKGSLERRQVSIRFKV